MSAVMVVTCFTSVSSIFVIMNKTCISGKLYADLTSGTVAGSLITEMCQEQH